MLRRAEAGVHVDVDVSDGLVSVPAGDLLDHQLQLVQQLRVHRRVTRPHSPLIMVEKIADLEVLGNREVDVGRADLEKSFRRRCLSPHSLGEIRPNSVAAQHSALFLAEGNEDSQGQPFN